MTGPRQILPPYLVRVGARVLPRRYPYYTMTMLAEDIARERGVSMPIAALMAAGFDRTGAEIELSVRGPAHK